MRVFFGVLPGEPGYVEPRPLTQAEIDARQQRSREAGQMAYYRALFEAQDAGVMSAFGRDSVADLKGLGAAVAKLGK